MRLRLLFTLSHPLARPPRYFTRRGAPGGAPPLPEFEAGDWKAARRWRLLAFDGVDVTVADFTFKDRTVAALEPTATVRFGARCARGSMLSRGTPPSLSSFLPLISLGPPPRRTSPPSQVKSHIIVITHASAPAGPGPAAAAAAAAVRGAAPSVRALVLPRAPGAPGVAAAQLRWACGAGPEAEGAVSGVVDLEEGSGHAAVAPAPPPPARHRRRPSAGNSSGGAGDDKGGAARFLYVGELGGHLAVGCGSELWVQARVTDVEGGVSASAWRRVVQEGDSGGGSGGGGGGAQAAGEAAKGWGVGSGMLGRKSRLVRGGMALPRAFGSQVAPCLWWYALASRLPTPSPPIHAPPPPPGMAGAAALAAPGWRARFMIGAADWPGRARSIFLLAWALHLGALLLLPRFAPGLVLSAHARLAYPLLGRSPSLMRMASAGAARRAGAPPPPPGAARRLARAAGRGARVVAGWAAAVVARVGRLAALLAIWPLRVSCGAWSGLVRPKRTRLATAKGALAPRHLVPPAPNPPPQVMAECWTRCGAGPAFPAMAAFSALLLSGPWHLARTSGDAAGLGALFPWAVVLRPPGRGPLLYPCADPCLSGSALMCITILPFTVWLVSCRRGRRGARQAARAPHGSRCTIWSAVCDAAP
jgi:hypothetical protein